MSPNSLGKASACRVTAQASTSRCSAPKALSTRSTSERAGRQWASSTSRSLSSVTPTDRANSERERPWSDLARSMRAPKGSHIADGNAVFTPHPFPSAVRHPVTYPLWRWPDHCDSTFSRAATPGQAPGCVRRSVIHAATWEDTAHGPSDPPPRLDSLVGPPRPPSRRRVLGLLAVCTVRHHWVRRRVRAAVSQTRVGLRGVVAAQGRGDALVPAGAAVPGGPLRVRPLGQAVDLSRPRPLAPGPCHPWGRGGGLPSPVP